MPIGSVIMYELGQAYGIIKHCLNIKFCKKFSSFIFTLWFWSLSKAMNRLNGESTSYSIVAVPRQTFPFCNSSMAINSLLLKFPFIPPTPSNKQWPGMVNMWMSVQGSELIAIFFFLLRCT